MPLAWALVVPLVWWTPAWAQTPVTGQQEHKHGQTGESTPSWRLMQDGVVYGLFNHQGGPRGGREFVAPNWWMGMVTRDKGRHQFGFNAMISLDPATVGKNGYGEIFQVGEALDGRPLIDRQHPHDFLTQLAASWRMSFGEVTAAAGLTARADSASLASGRSPTAG